MEEQKTQNGLGPHKKATLFTHEHIIKGSSPRLPFATANEHLCMQVAAKVVETAKTELSKDGNVLLVHRFDVDENGAPFWALEDFCALLGLNPHKSTKPLGRELQKPFATYVDGKYQYETFQKLTKMLLMTYALRNADCHSKNLALLYTSRNDARLAPVYDFFTTSVYAGYRDNPPGISFGAKNMVTRENSREVHHSKLQYPGKGAETMLEKSVMRSPIPLLRFAK